VPHPPDIAVSIDQQEDMQVATRTTRARPQSIPVTHLLSFEVVNPLSSPDLRFLGSSSTSMATRRHRTIPFNKQRYIHASFRFVVCDVNYRNTILHAKNSIDGSPDVDAPLPWETVEAVVVDVAPQNAPTCPVCLEWPMRTPKMTCCGHVFCWPCLLRYVLETASSSSHLASHVTTTSNYSSSPSHSSSSAGSRWRKCPICFEPMHPKQLRSVLFHHVEQHFFVKDSSDSITSADFSLLKRSANGRLECLDPTVSDAALLFDKIIRVPARWIVDHVIATELADLQQVLATECGEASMPFLESAIALSQDRLQSLLSTAEPSSTSSSPTRPLGDAVFVHQSSDGQNVFLHPLCIKMLKRAFGTYANMPRHLLAPVVDVEYFGMTMDIRRRFKHIAHLPLGAQFGLAEVDLRSVVDRQVLAAFEPELRARRDSRLSLHRHQDRHPHHSSPRLSDAPFEELDPFSCAMTASEGGNDLSDLQHFPALLSTSSLSTASSSGGGLPSDDGPLTGSAMPSLLMERPKWVRRTPSPDHVHSGEGFRDNDANLGAKLRASNKRFVILGNSLHHHLQRR
jgi:hypothetical protein